MIARQLEEAAYSGLFTLTLTVIVVGGNNQRQSFLISSWHKRYICL
jgi:hypothetical protein